MSLNILCLDDNLLELAEHLQALKKDLDATIHPVDTWQSAAALVKQQSFDLFILDIEITGERATGIQLAQEIRRLPQYTQTPILFVSMYSHYSRHLLCTIPHSAFLSKPFSPAMLTAKAGWLLGIPRYVTQAYVKAVLTVAANQGSYLEIDAARISFLELNRGVLMVQYIDGEVMRFRCPHGGFKTILDQIRTMELTYLRQIYRSVIINVDQIKKIDLSKNVGEVWLFSDDTPKPIGNRYRDRLREFL